MQRYMKVTGAGQATCRPRGLPWRSQNTWAKVAFAMTTVASTMTLSAPAHAFDMDCKVILCLAAGFPSGCGDAHSYMTRRLKKGRKPFGTCSGGKVDGGTYDVPVRVFSRNIRPQCITWVSARDGRHCSNWTPGRQEKVIEITVPQDNRVLDYSNEFIWWSRPWDPFNYGK